MSAYGYDDEGEREHDCCDVCGRGSCPGSGSRGPEACNDSRRSTWTDAMSDSPTPSTLLASGDLEARDD